MKPSTDPAGPILSRRRLLMAGAGAVSAIACPAIISPAAAVSVEAPWRLKLSHAHTGEKLWVTYRLFGRDVPEAIAEINGFFRDFRTGEVMEMDRMLIDSLSGIQKILGQEREMIVTSGYRSKATNDMLREKGVGAAQRSLHIEGRATDFFIKGWGVSQIANAARGAGVGGVGVYPSSSFVHVDVGQRRTWIR